MCFATAALGYGGPDRVIMLLAQAAAAAGHETTIITGRVADSQSIEACGPGVRVVEIGDRKYPIRALSRELPSDRHSVVVATQRMILASAIAMYLTRSRAKLIIRPANHPSASLDAPSNSLRRRRVLAARLELLVGRRVDGVICQSPEVDSAIWRMGGRLGAAPRAILPNPVAATSSEPSPAVLAPGMTVGKPTIVTMGRLSHQKGYDLLLRALPAVIEQCPATQLWILGKGEDEALLRRLSSEMQLDGHVTFAGHVDHPIGLLKMADLYVMASRYEGLSNALLEAQALGLPAVATTGAASGHQIVRAGRTGWLCEPNSVSELIEALVLATAKYKALDRAEISRLTTQEFDPAAIWARYAEFIQSVLV